MSRAPFVLFLAALTIFRVWYSGLFELSLDEPYYWLWSQHPQLSYYDHPPMAAWLISIFTAVADSERFVRLAAVLCASGATWFLYELASDMFNDRRSGLLAAAFFNVIPLTSLGSVIITPDSPLILFWSGALFFGYKAIDTQNPLHFYSTGLFCGLAMLSKYTAVFFAPSFLLFLMSSPENRHWLFRREPYLGFALSMILFLPVIYWNSVNDWVSFRFQFAHGFSQDTGGAAMRALEFWGGQIGLFGIFGFILVIWAAIGMAKMGIREKRDDFLYISFMTLAPMLFFIVNSFKSRMEGNWGVVAYLAAIAAAPGFVKRFAGSFSSVSSGRWIERGLTASLAFMFLLTAYAHIQVVDPILPMPQKREVSRRVYGWKTLGGEVSKRLAELKGDSFIVTQRYQISSLLGYYTPGRPEAFMMTGAGRFGYLGSAEKLLGRNAVYVEETERIELDKVKKSFKKVEPAGVIRIERHGELIREFSIFKCYNYKGGLVET